MSRLNNVELRVVQSLEDDLTEPALRKFMESMRLHYRLASISYFYPLRSIWLIKEPCLSLAYGDAWVDHCATRGEPLGAELDWTFLRRVEFELQWIRAEADVDFGRYSLTVPLRGAGAGLAALFNVTAQDDDAEWAARRCPAYIKDLIKVGHYVHRCAHRLRATDAGTEMASMTRREFDALRWFAKGMRLEDISMLMSVAPAEARSFLDSARDKLGALNYVHAAAKALRAKLI